MPPGRVFYIWLGLWLVSAGNFGLSLGASIGLDNHGQKFGPESDSCLKYAGPIEIRFVDGISNAVQEKIDFFEPFRFRANNYGTAEYELESTFLGEPIFNIKMDSGPRPDTVKGGDLDGFYGFYRSFLVPRTEQNPSQVKLPINGTRIVFEIWNVYIRKNSSDPSKAKVLHELISLNVLFEIGDKRNVRFDPILRTMREMSRNYSIPVKLHMNYDPYGLLPLQGAFAVYETSAFPFRHPIPVQSQPKSPCQPLVKVYLYEKRLTMSEGQFQDCLKMTSQIIGSEPNMASNVTTVTSNHFSPKIYYTPKSEHLIFRRTVAEAEPNEADEPGEGDDSEYYDDEPDETDDELEGKPSDPKYNVSGPIEPEDESLFPPDCSYLYRLQNIMEAKILEHRSRNGGSHQIISISTFFLPFLPIIVKF